MRQIITKHADSRIEKRLNLEETGQRNTTFHLALRSGKDISDFEDPFKSYLNSRLRKNCFLKVYEDFIWIYSIKWDRNVLITTYPVPYRYRQNISSEEIHKKQINILKARSNYLTGELKKFEVLLKDSYGSILTENLNTFKQETEQELKKVQKELEELQKC